MTILPRVHGGDPEQQNEFLDATNPVVVSANFVLGVSHAHYTTKILLGAFEVAAFDFAFRK